jgi:catechol 2,3-dioxygenase-like lactoylglutathione lyase family enzyme
MLDHMILTASNGERSLAFYEAALKPLDIKFFLPYKGEGDHRDLWGFGDGRRAFSGFKQGKPDPTSVRWGFMAESNGKVDEFYRAAMPAGARDNISPRARVEY